MRDDLSISGRLSVVVQRQDRSVDRSSHENLVVSSGAALIACLLAGTQEPVSHMAIGVGKRPKASQDVSLDAEVIRVPVSSLSTEGGKATFKATFPSPNEPIFFTEAGLFNAPEGGSMLSRAVFEQREQFAGDIVDIEWVVTISQGKQ